MGPGLVLRVTGDPAAVRQAGLEYAPTRTPDHAPPDVDVAYGPLDDDDAQGASTSRGGHKSVRWGVRLGRPDEPVLRARIDIGGWPGAFARSLVQGYFLEPLLSMAAPRHDLVLLPSAGIVGEDGLIVVMGRSRAGKSTLAARSLALGFEVSGDDQLLVSGTVSVWPFPRRSRFYPDLERTAPAAFRALRPSNRARLRLRGVVSRLTGGFVRPSLAVDPAELGSPRSMGPRPPARVIMLDRRDGVTHLEERDASPEDAIAWAGELLTEQRAKLSRAGGEVWRTAIADVTVAEAAILSRAFGSVPIASVTVPRAWPAPRAVSAVARQLGLDAPRAT